MAEGSRMAEAIETVYEELDRVRRVKKCTSCECLLDVLQAVQRDMAGIGLPEAESARGDFRTWFETGNVKRHRCLGCEVCLPTEPYNRFSASLREAGFEQQRSPQAEAEGNADCGCGGT